MNHRTLLSALALLLPVAVGAQLTAPFKVGETLHYDANFNFVRAGSAKLQVVSLESLGDVRTYHILFTVETNPLLDRIYRIRDRVEIWIDAEKLFTRKLTKSIQEGRYQRTFSANINYEDSLITTDKNSLKIRGEIRDPYSLFYYLRSIPLKVGDRSSFTTFDNNRFTDFKVGVHRKEAVKVPSGIFECLVIEPFRKGRSLFKDRGDMTIWLSDDENRLPIRIKSKLKFGSMVLELREATGI